MFDPEQLAASMQLVGEAIGRGTAWFCNYQGQEWVLRHYRRGGWIGRYVSDLYLGVCAENSRAFREWRLLAALTSLGLPVPRPVAAAFRRRGCVYRADLITVRLPATRTLADCLQQKSLAKETWQSIGAALKRFHIHGVYHADLNARNILIDNAGAVFLIDFDRGALRSGENWKQKTLLRLSRSLDKIMAQTATFYFSQDDWQALLQGYSQENSPGGVNDNTPARKAEESR